ncbi:hypothetical protein PENTCL1PPCAC_7105, partial [Pristionchus entomophagus]
SRIELEQAMTTMVFQRRFADAKKLEKRFDVIEHPQKVDGKVPNMNEYESKNEVYLKLRLSHRQFIAS